MNKIPKLIYDVGMHNGDDTAYSLHKGFHVVAIEANPTLAQAGEKCFADAVRSNNGVYSIAVANNNASLQKFDLRVDPPNGRQALFR